MSIEREEWAVEAETAGFRACKRCLPDQDSPSAGLVRRLAHPGRTLVAVTTRITADGGKLLALVNSTHFIRSPD